MTNAYYAIVSEPATVGAGGALIATLRLSGEFDLGACDDLRAALLGVIVAGLCTRIVVDLAAVSFIDSEMVRVLLEGYHGAQRHGLHYRLAHVHGLPRRVLDVMGLTRLLAPDDPDQLSHPAR